MLKQLEEATAMPADFTSTIAQPVWDPSKNAPPVECDPFAKAGRWRIPSLPVEKPVTSKLVLGSSGTSPDEMITSFQALPADTLEDRNAGEATDRDFTKVFGWRGTSEPRDATVALNVPTHPGKPALPKSESESTAVTKILGIFDRAAAAVSHSAVNPSLPTQPQLRPDDVTTVLPPPFLKATLPQADFEADAMPTRIADPRKALEEAIPAPIHAEPAGKASEAPLPIRSVALFPSMTGLWLIVGVALLVLALFIYFKS